MNANHSEIFLYNFWFVSLWVTFICECRFQNYFMPACVVTILISRCLCPGFEAWSRQGCFVVIWNPKRLVQLLVSKLVDKPKPKLLSSPRLELDNCRSIIKYLIIQPLVGHKIVSFVD